MKATLAIAVLFASVALAGDDDKLPDSRANAARIRYEKAVVDAKTRYHMEVAKAEAEYVVELESAIKRATAANRFDAVKALMAEKESVGQRGFSGTAWAWGPNGTDRIRFMSDGSTRVASGDGPRWSEIDDTRAAVVYPNGAIDIVVMSSNGESIEMVIGPRPGAPFAHRFSRQPR